MGVFWKRLNGKGALASLYTGFVMGVLRLVLELGYNAWGWKLGVVEPLVTMNFLHFAMLMFAVCVGVLVVVSLATPIQAEEQLRGLTFATTPKEARVVDIADSTRRGRRITIIGTVILIGALIVLWAIFYVVVPLSIGK